MRASFRSKHTLFSLAALAGACGGQGKDPAAPDMPPAAAFSTDIAATALPSAPTIAVSDSSIRFCYAPGSTRNCVFLTEHIRITSIHKKALRWKASSDQPWLVVSPTTGRTPTSVKVSVDRSKLPPRSGQGVHGIITLSAAAAANSPLTIPVSVSFVAIPLSLLSGP